MKQHINSSVESISNQPRRMSSTLLGHSAGGRPTVRAGAQSQHRTKKNDLTASRTVAYEDTRSVEERQRQAEIEQDLQLARDIQQGLLLAAAPHLPGWELSAVSLPARDLGGDLYDFLHIEEGLHGIMIGDVAGKGLPAALQMAVTRTVFRNEARRGNTPALTLASVNRGVISEIPRGMVTMLYALLDPLHGNLCISNAGHTFPLIINGNVEELELSGLPLGVDHDIDYEEINITLHPGDSVVLYSDGITEAMNVEYDMFGLERLQQLLIANRHLKPRAIVSLLLHELRAWSADHNQSDDITIVVLRRRMACLYTELRSIAEDVLGIERTSEFWEEVIALHTKPIMETTPDDWIGLLPNLSKLAQGIFGRGLTRELQQQLRLAIEDYRI